MSEEHTLQTLPQRYRSLIIRRLLRHVLLCWPRRYNVLERRRTCIHCGLIIERGPR